MTKPTTTYAEPAFDLSNLATEAGEDLLTEASEELIMDAPWKAPTSFTPVAKTDTSYTRSSSDSGGWLLNSTVVKLNSTVYLLSGYTSATPNQTSNKNATAYTEL